MVAEEAVDWAADEYWRNRRLSPAQLIVHDVDLQGWRPDSERTHVGPLLEINEVFVSSLQPALKARDHLAETLNPEAWTTNRQEQEGLRSIAPSMLLPFPAIKHGKQGGHPFSLSIA